MSQGAAAKRLWRTARRVALGLKRRGFWAVAVSGSLARGDAGDGSDVDLWAVGPSSGRDEGFVGEVPVTVFRDRPSALLHLPWISRWEVNRLVVLFDERGDFRRLSARYRRHWPSFRAHLLKEYQQRLLLARRRSRRGPATERLLASREVRWAQVTQAVWMHTGILVPKWKHLEALLPSKELVRLRKDLALQPRPATRATLAKLVPLAPRAIERLFLKHFAEVGTVPRWAGAEAHLAQGGYEEALLKVRSDLDRWLAYPLRERLPRTEVASFLDAAAEPALSRLFRVAYGL